MVLRKSYDHGQFCWVDLAARDMAAAKDFYRGLFGWAAEDQDTAGGPPYAQFLLDEHCVAGLGQLNEEMKAQGVPATWNSYVNVDDAAAVVRRVEDLGGSVTVPCMKAADAGWLAFFKDPTGAHLALWQKDRHVGAAVRDEPGSFCWNELATRDTDGAREFFGSLFGWKFEDNPESPAKYYMAKNRGRDAGGIIEMDEKWGDLPAHWMVYFNVADVEVSVQRIRRLGGQVCVEPTNIPVGRFSVVSDPQGATFSVIQLNRPVR